MATIYYDKKHQNKNEIPLNIYLHNVNANAIM